MRSMARGEQHADYAIRRRNPEWTDLDSVINAPDVTVNKIVYVRRSGDVFRLFLEDMNGSDLNASSRAVLFEVINSLHENAGQFVITSNLAIPEFKRQYGEDLFWRIAHHCTEAGLARPQGWQFGRAHPATCSRREAVQGS